MKEIMTKFDETYFCSEQWLEYTKLWDERPELFFQSELLRLHFDKETILDFMNRTGRKIGVLYRSPYSIMVVDLVSGPDKVLFAYERLLPAVSSDAVVIVPRYGNKYILLMQYRHSLRKELIAFPRGFGESGLSAVENAAKELSEEVGALTLEARLIGYVDPDSGMVSNRVAVVGCTVDRVLEKQGYEGIRKVMLLTEEELIERIKDGSITDGYTLSALTLLSAQK